MANAPTNSLYVNSAGRIGLGTATPVLKLHLVAGDTPAIRLEQDTSSGWTAQVWDVAGNESNFFVRDTTGGSKLPFRIQSRCAHQHFASFKADGKVGIGTWSPGYKLEVQTTGEDSAITATGLTARPCRLPRKETSPRWGPSATTASTWLWPIRPR